MKFNIITADRIIDTGMVSFKFIFDSKSDYNNHDKVKKWGSVRKGDGVTINVFESGKGLVFGWGNDKFEDQQWLAKLVEKCPETTLLMESDNADVLKSFCEHNNIEYTYHHYDGTLTTS